MWIVRSNCDRILYRRDSTIVFVVSCLIGNVLCVQCFDASGTEFGHGSTTKKEGDLHYVYIKGDSEGSFAVTKGDECPVGTLTIGSTVSITAYNGNCNDIPIVAVFGTTGLYGQDGFVGCDELSSVVFPDSLQWIGNYAFARTSLSSVEFPSSLQTIGKQAFHDVRLTSVTFKGVGPVTCDTNDAFSSAVISVSGCYKGTDFAGTTVTDSNLECDSADVPVESPTESESESPTESESESPIESASESVGDLDEGDGEKEDPGNEPGGDDGAGDGLGAGAIAGIVIGVVIVVAVVGVIVFFLFVKKDKDAISSSG